MIPMACPNCGRRGTVPPDKLNSRLHCKKCDAVFHMDSTGHVVLGEPGQKGKAPKAPRAERERRDVDLDFGRKFKELPTAVKVIGGLVLVIGLAYLFGLRIPKFSVPVPQDLLGRAGFVANAFAEERPNLLSKVAAPGTESSVDQWYQELRPRLDYKGPQVQGNMILVSGSIEREDAVAGDALVVVTITPPTMKIEKGKRDRPGYWAGYRANGNFSVPLYWSKDAEGNWVLDGTRTLESLKEAEAGQDSSGTTKKS